MATLTVVQNCQISMTKHCNFLDILLFGGHRLDIVTSCMPHWLWKALGIPNSIHPTQEKRRYPSQTSMIDWSKTFWVSKAVVVWLVWQNRIDTYRSFRRPFSEPRRRRRNRREGRLEGEGVSGGGDCGHSARLVQPDLQVRFLSAYVKGTFHRCNHSLTLYSL